MERERKQRKDQRGRKRSYNPDDGTQYEYDSESMEEYVYEEEQYQGDYMRSPSKSFKKNKNAKHSDVDLEISFDHVLHPHPVASSPNPHHASVYV